MGNGYPVLHQVSVHKNRDILQLLDIINLLEWLGLRVVI